MSAAEDAEGTSERLYASRAMTEADWAQHCETMLAEGWEYRLPVLGVVYLRKHLAGPKGERKGWLPDK